MKLNLQNTFQEEQTRLQGTFEIHLASPKMSYEEGLEIFKELEAIGLAKNKYFLSVLNIPQDANYRFVLDTPPTGHDLDEPYFMSTAIVSTFEEAKHLVIEGMKILRNHGKEGNFEIERVIGEQTSEVTIDVEQEFPEFRQIEDSPRYENHIVLRGTLTTLPSNAEIIRFFQNAMGVTIHQIVDFAKVVTPDENTRVSRVATIYQPSRQAALEFSQRLKQVENTLGYGALVAEQVCLVGEYKDWAAAKELVFN